MLLGEFLNFVSTHADVILKTVDSETWVSLRDIQGPERTHLMNLEVVEGSVGVGCFTLKIELIPEGIANYVG